jgi:hypothetical protein
MAGGDDTTRRRRRGMFDEACSTIEVIALLNRPRDLLATRDICARPDAAREKNPLFD